ncbi:MAG: DUF3237 domain-containing protein [bacterium]|nr:DUF3237 domain-containing protein [bacterium]MCP5068732.1 DUF3237 domain-containing protein [bacterium]
MKLEPLMTCHVDLKPPVQVGKGPHGTRTIFDVVGGTAEGARVTGRFLPSGGDWLLVDEGGVGRLDVRGTVQTDDGAHVYVHYHGVLEFNEKVTAALGAGTPTDYGDTYFMTQPRYETGDPRYAWLNRVVAVAEGRVLAGAVEYRVFHVVNDG